MATLGQELSLHLRDALVACGELGRVIGDAPDSGAVTGMMAADCAGRLERVAAKIRASVAKAEVSASAISISQADAQMELAMLNDGLIDYPGDDRVRALRAAAGEEKDDG